MNLLRKSCVGAMVGLMLLAFTMPAISQTVDVTFVANMATHPDTINSSHYVQMRGTLNNNGDATFPGGEKITWDGASDLVMTNAGGDYWTLTIEMNVADTLYYKFWTGFDAETGTAPNGGWEGGFSPSNGLTWDTRTFIVGDADTTLDVQYYHPDGSVVDQYLAPFESKEDTLALYFRVNMAQMVKAGKFLPDTEGPVGLRGDGGNNGGLVDWGETRVLLTREEGSTLDGSFFSGVAYVDKDSITVGNTLNYKFFVEGGANIDWENSIGNRELPFPASDSTIAWVWFDDQPYQSTDPVDGNIVFRVNVTALEDVGLFDQTAGDAMKVIGPKGWDIPADFIDMDYNPLLNEWTANEPFNAIPGSKLVFKYFVDYDSSRVDENSANYIPLLKIKGLNDDNDHSGWEEPGVTGGADRSFIFEGIAQQFLEGDFGRDNQYYNSLLPESKIGENVMLTWSIDMNPAADRTTNPDLELFRLGTDTVYIEIDTPMARLLQGFDSREEARYMLEDPDGDGIYEGTFEMYAPFWNMVDYIITYTSDNGLITNGSGTQFGRRYYQFIKPISVTENGPVWPTEYTFDTLPWTKPQECIVEEPWDLLSNVTDQYNGLPNTFSLEQNYPNPFNPSTSVRYHLPEKSEVTINVYNSIGQLVRTLVHMNQPAGSYEVTWNGATGAGSLVPSGVYFMEMKAGNFNAVKKMTLLK